MEYNSENISDANGVHLEGNFLFSLSFFVTRNRNFWPMRNYFFLYEAKGCIVILFFMFSQLFPKCSNVITPTWLLVGLRNFLKKYCGEINCDTALTIIVRLYFFNCWDIRGELHTDFGTKCVIIKQIAWHPSAHPLLYLPFQDF